MNSMSNKRARTEGAIRPVRPFRGLRPEAAQAQAVVAPPYDVLSSEEARIAAAGRPFSFLHVSKAEIDLPPGTDPYSPAVYQKARENFERMRREGILKQDPAAFYYVYELTMGSHRQRGLVASASVAAYAAGHIRRHEHTRPDKEDDRVRQIDALNAQTGPVFLTHRERAPLTALLATASAATPAVDVNLNGVRHRLWVVSDPAAIERISEEVAQAGVLYIADGHHRSAAAARVAQLRAAGNPGHRGDEAYNYFLAVLFPDSQMQILDYNRVVRDLNGLAPDAFMQRLAERFVIVPSRQPVKPAVKGEFGLYLQGRWYRLRGRSPAPPADPVEALDVRQLDRECLAPLLGITDPRRDRRIDFVGGIRGLAELERRVDSGEMAAAFSLYPTALSELMAVADTGEVMPPKSTWFEPKLADGLVSQTLD